MIKKCYEALSEGGIIFITTPNTSSFGHRIFKGNWRGLEPPRHIFIFSPASIRKILEDAGFKTKIHTSCSKRILHMFEESCSENRKAKIAYITERVSNLFLRKIGEEIIARGKK
jgi:predicted SAM-dependent methyltransferase